MIDLHELKKTLGELEEEKLMCLLNNFVASNPSPEEAQKAIIACQEGMSTVGSLFEKKEYFVADLIYAGELLKKAIGLLGPILESGASADKRSGVIILGTVQGDVHDIGKNIFKSMVESAGFVVHDLGIDLPPGSFVDGVKKINPDIVGMSGLLTLSLESMRTTVAALEEAGVRDKIKIIIGGSPVSKDSCAQIRADAFTTNAAEGVRISKGWVS